MRNRLVLGLAALSFVAASCSSDPDNGETVLDVPPVDPATGLRAADFGPVPLLPDWPDNPPNETKKGIGKAIYFDTRVSGSGTATCGGCHLSMTNFQSSSPLDLPDRSFPMLGPTLPRHTPSLLNLVYAPMMRWDGSHFTDLYDMAVFPLAEANMNLASSFPLGDVESVDLAATQVALKKKLTVDIPGYAVEFEKAFGEDIDKLSPAEVWRLAGKSVATYLRVAVARDAAFDRWNMGDDKAMSEAAVRGFALFRGRGKCSSCHSGPLFSDFQFHNVSTALPDAAGKRADEGRSIVTNLAEDGGKFLTPMLRSSALTSPYLHDGSETTIAAIVRKKSGTRGTRDPNHDPILDQVGDFSDAEIEDIVAFIKALNGKPLHAAEINGPTSFPN